MDFLSVLAVSLLALIAGFVGYGLWLSNQRAIEQLRQDNLNYREQLRQGGGSSSGPGGQQDMLTTIIQMAMANPDLVKNLLGQGTGGQQPPQFPPQQ